VVANVGNVLPNVTLVKIKYVHIVMKGCVLMAAQEIKNCSTCTRKERNSCLAFTDRYYFFDKYGYCYAWTNDPNILTKLKNALKYYREGNYSHFCKKIS
jgi:hypothetical protein